MSVCYEFCSLPADTIKNWSVKYPDLNSQYDNDEIDEETYESAKKELWTENNFPEIYPSETHHHYAMAVEDVLKQSLPEIEKLKPVFEMLYWQFVGDSDTPNTLDLSMGFMYANAIDLALSPETVKELADTLDKVSIKELEGLKNDPFTKIQQSFASFVRDWKKALSDARDDSRALVLFVSG